MFQDLLIIVIYNYKNTEKPAIYINFFDKEQQDLVTGISISSEIFK